MIRFIISCGIWTKDTNGQDQLLALGQAGVGAIYLGNVSTEFSMKDAAGNTQGQMRTSSVFLKENGQAGMVKQIDLVVLRNKKRAASA